MPEYPPSDISCALFAKLDELGIAHRTLEHAAVFTVPESQALRGIIPGAHSKNLFVKDKKGRLFLVTALEDASIDLKRLHEAIGAQGRVSFANADQLRTHLGVEPGSVTPFAAINDREGKVTVVLQKALTEAAVQNFHPLINTRTTTIAKGELERFLAAVGHVPLILDLPERTESDAPPSQE